MQVLLAKGGRRGGRGAKGGVQQGEIRCTRGRVGITGGGEVAPRERGWYPGRGERGKEWLYNGTEIRVCNGKEREARKGENDRL